MIDIEDVKTLRVGPGQMPVIQCGNPINMETKKRIRDAIERDAPMLKDRLLIIDSSISLAVVDA